MLQRFQVTIPDTDSEQARPRRRGERTDEIAVYYDDGKVVHACECVIRHPDLLLVWTKCDLDVPAAEAFTLEYCAIEITCPTCCAAGPRG